MDRLRGSFKAPHSHLLRVPLGTIFAVNHRTARREPRSVLFVKLSYAYAGHALDIAQQCIRPPGIAGRDCARALSFTSQGEPLSDYFTRSPEILEEGRAWGLAQTPRLSHPGYAAEFGEGLVEYLNEVTVDGGADSNKVYVMARQMTDAKVWNRIDVNALAELLMRAPEGAVAVFTQALPAKQPPSRPVLGERLDVHSIPAQQLRFPLLRGAQIRARRMGLRWTFDRVRLTSRFDVNLMRQAS